MSMPAWPTQEQIEVAADWLRYNEGEGHEGAACRAVADWIEALALDHRLKSLARENQIPVAVFRRRVRQVAAKSAKVTS